MQAGRGGGLASAFGGGGGGQTLFGGRGATTVLTKATWILGTAFMVTSLFMALAIGKRQTVTQERSLLQENPIEVPGTTEPLTPAEGVPVEIPVGQTPSAGEETTPSDEEGEATNP
jgi:preprotein translocase subunit SecG